MQKRIFEYRDDDKTIDIDGQLLGIVEPGVYRGFDANLTTGLTLELVHTQSGATYADETPSVVEDIGILRTKQGTVIRETAEVEVVIAANDYGVGHPGTRNRIDLIVCEHWHQDTVGGATAIYYAIPGVQATNPVAPALTDPAKQIIIGTLYLPGGCTLLADTGVVFTKATLPANPSLPDTAYPAYYDDVNFKIWSDYKDRAYYYVVPGGVSADYPEVRSFELFTIPNMVATLISGQKMKYVAEYGIMFNSQNDFMISEAFEEIQVYLVGVEYGGTSSDHVLVNTGRLYKNQVNKLYMALIGNIGTAATLSSGLLTCDPDGNIQKITVGANADFKGVNTFAQANTLPGYNSGMQLIVQISTTYRVTLKHLAAGVTAPYKNIYIYGKRDVILSGNITLYMYEDTDKFVLFQWNADTTISSTGGQFANRNGIFCGTGASEAIEALKSLMVTDLQSEDLLFIDEIVAGVSESGQYRYTVKIRNAPTVNATSQGSTAWLTWTELSSTRKTSWERIVMTEDDGSGCNAIIVIDWGKLTLTSYQFSTYKEGALFGISHIVDWSGDNSIPLPTLTGTTADIDGSGGLYLVDSTANVVLTLKAIELCRNKFSIQNQTGYECRVESNTGDPFGNAQVFTVAINGGTATLWKNGTSWAVTGDVTLIYI